MKKGVLLLYSLCCVLNINAQSWQWVNGQTCGNGLGDGYLCKTDIYNNVYIGGINDSGNNGDSICFGSHKLFSPPLSSQIIIAKYDSLGNLRSVINSSYGNAFPINIITDHTGKLYLFGYFWSDSIMFGSTLITNSSYNVEKYHF